MSFAVRRAIAFALPILILPMAAHGAPKVGTVTNSNNAVVARDGKVVPATDNMPLEKGDKVMTRDGGSADVQLADRSVKLGPSSAMSTDDGKSVSMDGKSASNGNGKDEAAQQLASAESQNRHDDDEDDDHGNNGNHFGHCKGKGHEHHNDDGPGRGHGHGHDHECPPVSP
jgi:hypothetical protein